MPLDEWRRVARDVSGRALPCGPLHSRRSNLEVLLAEMLAFFEAERALKPALASVIYAVQVAVKVL